MLKANVAGKRTLVHKNQAKKWKCCRWRFATIQYLCCAYSMCCCVTVLMFGHISVVGRMKPKVKSRAALLSRQHWRRPDLVATGLETALLKYKWRLVTVLIDGALQQRRLKSMSATWSLETEGWGVMLVIPTPRTPQSLLINKWKRHCVSWEMEGRPLYTVSHQMIYIDQKNVHQNTKLILPYK